MGTRIAHGQNYFPEIRLRVAARTSSRADAEIIGNEVESLYLNGPAGAVEQESMLEILYLLLLSLSSGVI